MSVERDKGSNLISLLLVPLTDQKLSRLSSEKDFRSSRLLKNTLWSRKHKKKRRMKQYNYTYKLLWSYHRPSLYSFPPSSSMTFCTCKVIRSIQASSVVWSCGSQQLWEPSRLKQLRVVVLLSWARRQYQHKLFLFYRSRCTFVITASFASSVRDICIMVHYG